MRYQNEFVSKDKNIYSCDMIRLNFDLGEHLECFIKYMNSLGGYDLRYDIKYYPNYSQYKYRHLWSVKDVVEECSWSIGTDLGKNSESKSKGFIEFNPNKCWNIPTFMEFWEKLCDCTFCERALVRYDLAIDLPIKRHLAKLIRVGRSRYGLISEDDGITEYLGTRNHSGFIKVYDKTIESGLDYDLTRVEITLGRDDNAMDKCPDIWLYDEQISINALDGLSSTQKALVIALRQIETPNMVLNQLCHEMRKKIEPYVRDKTLNLDITCVNQVRQFALSFES